MQMIRVLRQLPRNSRIISPVSAAAIAASFTTPSTEARTNTDWWNSGVNFGSLALGRRGRIRGTASFTRLTMSSVEALPGLWMETSAPFLPSAWTKLVCGMYLSLTWATSRMKTVVPLTVFTGKS